MADENRRVQLKVAHSSIWATQSDFGVPLDNAQLDAVMTTKEGGQSHIEPIGITEDLNDCTTQYLLDLIILHRYARLTLDLEVDKDQLAGLLKMALSVSSPPNIYMLGPTVFKLLQTTFIVGFADGTDSGVILSDAVCESLAITGQVDQKMQVQAVFVGRGDLVDATAYPFPDCADIVPLRFDENFTFILNGTHFEADTRKFAFNYNNNPPLKDFPFALGVVDISRQLERGNKRVCTFNWTVTGRLNDALGQACVTVPPTHYPLDVQIGSPGIIFTVADAMLRPAGAKLQDWDGEVALACLAIQLTPTRISGDSATPLAIEVEA